MPKSNIGNGGKKGKKGNKENVKRELITREDGQEYGICTAMLGCNRINVHLFSGFDVLGVIRGKIVNHMWITLGNVVLCGTREFQSCSTKVDVLLRYSSEEACELQRLGHIPDISHWSVVGRGGIEEIEDGLAGSIKFMSSGSKEMKATNDGWEMPSSEEHEDEEVVHDVPVLEGEQELEEEPAEVAVAADSLVEDTCHKQDRHKFKKDAKHSDNVRHRLVKANHRGGREPMVSEAAPAARLPQQKSAAPAQLDIDGI